MYKLSIYLFCFLQLSIIHKLEINLCVWISINFGPKMDVFKQYIERFYLRFLELELKEREFVANILKK
jgi:hypothetical protein